MSKISFYNGDQAIQDLLQALEQVKQWSTGKAVCLVCPLRKRPIVEAEYRSFIATLPSMGLKVDEVHYDDVADLYQDEFVRKLGKADLVIKLVHGPENRVGMVHAVLSSLDLPRIGHEHATDILSQRKSLVKLLMIRNGIPTLTYAFIHGGDSIQSLAPFFKQCPEGPFVIKQDDGNASEGLQYLPSRGGLEKAILECSGSYIVEPYVRGRVLTVGVVTVNQKLFPIPPLEYILTADQPVMDETWKSNPRRALAINIEPSVRDRIMSCAMELHRAVKARGLSRTDFILTDTNEIFSLEINTNIGLAEQNDIAVGFKENGLEYKDLLYAHLGSGLVS